MKKLVFFLVAITMSLFVSAQTVVFHENFELPSGGDSLITTADSAGFSTTSFIPWSLSTTLAKSGVRSDSNRVQSGKTIYLTSSSFSTVGNSYVILEFSQICKLFFGDGGQIEVSADGGTTWTTLGTTQYMGTGLLQQSKFFESSYNNDWVPGDTLTLPTNAWWKNEKFDISALVGNQANVKIRFKYYGSGNPTGNGRYGWLLDDIKVTANPSELVPPVITMMHYPIDTAFHGGPYNVYAYVKDASGIDTVFIKYNVDNGPFIQLGMTKSTTIDSLYSAGIPFVGYGRKVNYYITAIDASSAHNIAVQPITGNYSFVTKYTTGGNVIVGTGTSGQNYPFKANADFTKSASIYLATNLNKYGLINQLQWNVSTAQTTIPIPVKIYLKQTIAATMSVDNWDNLKNGAVLVYDGIQTFTSTGWKTINLTTPFNFNSGNLMVLCEANNGTAASATPSFYYTSGTSGTHQYFSSGASVNGTLSASRPNITVGFATAVIPLEDAGISQIVYPNGSVIAGTGFNVDVKVKNFGTDSLKKVRVYYKVDSNTPVYTTWTGNLYKDSSAVYTAGNINLTVGIHSLKVWTSLPNDSIDQNYLNDTAYYSFYACSGPLSGTYTVGGTGANFQTFADVFVGLSQCGISGPVVFNINPGTYSDQLTIPAIVGSSAINTITFKSATTDSSLVILNRTSNSASNWIVKLNGASNIIFKNIKFAPADPTYSTAVILTGGATNNKFIGNHFAGYDGTAASQTLFSVEGTTLANKNNIIQGNYFNKGSYSISVKGLSTAFLRNTVIKNNVIIDSWVYGIYAQYIDSTLIDSNTVNTISTNSSSKFGIYVQYGNILNKITKNTVIMTSGTNMYGILVENSLCTDTTKGLIANNFVSLLNGANYAYGIRLNTVTKYKVYANSVITNGNNASDTRAINIVSTSVGIDLKNNNLMSNKFPIHVEGTSVTECNYNNYYSTGATFGYWNNASYNSFAALVAASLKDSNSVNTNPFFNTLTDLHTFNGLLKGMGTNLADVTTDIDGAPRLSPPCIGADEFLPPAQDASLISLLKPIGGCGLTSTEDVKIVIKNVGSANILPNTITARYKFDSIYPVVSELVNRTINVGDTIHFTFTTKADLAVNPVTLADTAFKIRSWVDLTGDFAHANDSSSLFNFSSMFTPAAPTATGATVFYSNSAVLSAVSNKPLAWFKTLTSTTILGNGPSFTTPPLLATDTFYVAAKTDYSASAIIGTGTSANTNTGFPAPYGNYFWGTRNQILVTKAELNAQGVQAGPITSLAFQVQTAQGVPLQNFEIKAGHTPLAALTSGLTITGLTSVYLSPSYTDVAGWNTHTFTTPFVWNGIDNVIFETCFNNSSYTYNALMYYTPTTFNSVAYSYADASFSCANATTSVSMNRPNMKIQGMVPGCESTRVPVIANVLSYAHEAGISKIIAPTGCNLFQVPISVKIFNNSFSDTLKSTNCTVKYKLDNGSFITPEPINVIIKPFDTATYTFTVLANFTAPIGDRYIKVTAVVFTAGDANNLNDTLVRDSIFSRYTPPGPTTTNINIFNGTQATMTATAPGANVIWFDQSFGGTSLGQGSPFTTPFFLYVTDTFYVEASTNYAASGTIGTGTTLTSAYGYPTLFGNYWYQTWQQYLYTAAELNTLGFTAGPINSIAINTNSLPDANYFAPDFTIKVGSTSNSALTGFTTSNLTNVYGPTTVSGIIGWNTFAFTTPFIWDGISNIIVDIRQTEAYGNANATTYYTTTPNNSVVYAYSTSNNSSYWSSSPSATTSTSRPNIKIDGMIPGCNSARTPVIVTVSPPPLNDAGVTTLVNPVGSTPSGISTPVKVKIKNFGQNALTSATVVWTLNNVAKPNYSFTGNVPSGSDTTVTIANVTFSGGLYCVKAWTKNPNGVAVDSTASNDTLFSTCFTACLNGNYTIGDTTGGIQKDFPSFNAAVNALKAGGVCGNVTFLVDTGTYTEQVRIPQIIGANASNTITFRSASNDSTKVKLQYAAPSSTNYYTLQLDSAKYVTVKAITIRSTGVTYGRPVEAINTSMYNTISNCVLEMPVSTGSGFNGIYDYGIASCFNTYQYNRIVNGYYGVYLYGSSTTSLKPGTKLIGNKILDSYYYGIYSYYQDSIKIIGNEINSANAVYGIYTPYNQNAIQILKNKVILTSATGTKYGMYIYYCTGTATARGLIANNMISLSGTSTSSTAYGLYPYYSNYQNFYYNSVNVSVPSPTSGRALYHYYGTNQNLINNNFVNSGGGFAYYVASTTAITASDYNNIYTTGSVIGYWNANTNSFADLTLASAMDGNSVSKDPQFTSVTDLHLLSTDLSRLGTPIAGITDDIDGKLRDITLPTIGAHEVPLLQHDAGVTFISRPNNTEIESSTFPVKVAVKNFGIQPITSVQVTYKLNNQTPVSFTFTPTTPIASFATDSATFPSNMTVPAGTDSIIAYTTLTGDSNTFNNQAKKYFFGTPLFDAQVANITPISAGCGLTTDTVRIFIVNQGIMAINGGITASYKRSNGGSVVTETVNASIPVGGNYTFKFSTPVNLSVTTADINYQIASWATLTNDNIHNNDTAYTSINSLHTPPNPTVNNISIPYGTIANLVASSPTNDPLNWYDTIVGGSIIYSGTNYTTQPLYATDTFYVQSSTSISSVGYVGAISPLSTAGTGGGIGTYLNFTALSNTTLQSVDMFPYGTGAGTVTIALQTSTGAAITSATVNATGTTSPLNPAQTAVLNFPLTAGTSYRLVATAWTGGVTNLYRDLTGTYPYVLPGVLSIDGPSLTPYYYFWYNWKVGTSVPGCSSQRMQAIVNVGPQSPKDAGVIEIVTPVTQVNLTNNEVIKVKIKNFGSTPIYGLTLNYKIDNNTVVSQTITDTINVNDTLTKSFTQTANLSSNTQPQTFTIKAWTTLTNDATALNDTCKKTVINNPPVYCISSAIYTGDEDLGQVIFAGINHGNPLPVLNNPAATQMYNNYTDSTGFSATIQPGMTYPISLSIIFSNGTYDGKVNAYIDYNRNGVWDLPNELVFTGLYNGSSNSTLTGNITIPYTAIPGFTKMRIVVDESDVAPACGTYSWGETEDYKVNIIPPIPHDAGISNMNNMGSYIPYSSPNAQQPQFFIRNYGSDTLASAAVKIKLNGTTYNHPWSLSPALISLAIDSLTHPLTLIDGMNRLSSYTVLAGDTNYMNDTIHRKVFKEYATNPPYFDNFENNEYFYAIDTAEGGFQIDNLWEQGVPKASFIPNVPSGTKVWATKLDTNYTANNTSYLLSPVYLINPMQADSLKFWQWRKMAAGASAQLQYKGFSGVWQPLGDSADLNATNWYNHSTKIWKDSTNGWVQSTYKLSNLTGVGPTIQFRFVFKTIGATPLKYGWAIDDFSVTLLPLPADAGVINIITPNSTQSVGDSAIVKVTIKNFGTDPLNNIPVKYKVSTGSAIVTGTIVGPLAPGATVDYSFPQKYAIGTSSFSLCAYTAVNGDIYTSNDTSCKSITVIPAANDVGIIEILEPGNTVNTGQVIYPKVVIKNFGLNPQTSVPLSYQRGTATPITGTWTRPTPINTGDTAHFTFTTPITVAIGTSFSFSAFTTLATDAYSPNNKLIKSINICNVSASNAITGITNPYFGQMAVPYTADSVPNATTYTWTYSGSNYNINGNGTRFITIDFLGNATAGQLTVVASNATCSGNPTSININPVGIREIDVSNFWLGQNIPNPTTGLTNITYSLPSAGEVRFNIVNLYGQSVYSFNNVVDGGKHMIDLNVNDLSAGVYYYTIEYKGKRLVKKMVVNK